LPDGSVTQTPPLPAGIRPPQPQAFEPAPLAPQKPPPRQVANVPKAPALSAAAHVQTLMAGGYILPVTIE
jgi:hypothetical protein